MRKEQLSGENIFVVHDFLTPDECADFIAGSEQEGYGDAPVMMGGKPVLMKDFRNNERVIHDDVENDELKVDVVPRQGMALVFDHLQLHEGAPVISGRKYVLRTDVMFRPF